VWKEINRRERPINKQCHTDWDIENQHERQDRRRALHDPRHGLVGAIQYWASASISKVVTLFVLLLQYFGVMDLVLTAMLECSEDSQLVRDIRTRE
jgi:hypothetical protein